MTDENSKPIVRINLDVWDKIRALTDAAEGEIGGFLLIGDDGIIYDVVVPIQDVSAASVDVDSKDVVAAVDAKSAELGGADIDAKIRGSWHSHANMSAFHSSTDINMFTKWLLGSSDMPFLIELVTSKNHNHFLAVEFNHPFKFKIESELSVIYPSSDLSEWAKGIVKEKIKAKNYQTTVMYRGPNYCGEEYGDSWNEYYARQSEAAKRNTAVNDANKDIQIGDTDGKNRVVGKRDDGFLTVFNVETKIKSFTFTSPFEAGTALTLLRNADEILHVTWEGGMASRELVPKDEIDKKYEEERNKLEAKRVGRLKNQAAAVIHQNAETAMNEAALVAAVGYTQHSIRRHLGLDKNEEAQIKEADIKEVETSDE